MSAQEREGANRERDSRNHDEREHHARLEVQRSCSGCRRISEIMLIAIAGTTTATWSERGNTPARKRTHALPPARRDHEAPSAPNAT